MTTALQQRFLDTLARLTALAWLAAGILALWLVWSGLQPDVAAWAPLQHPLFGRAVLKAERLAPLALLLIAGLGHLVMPRVTEKGRGFGALALVPFLFCLGYFCSIYRPEAVSGLDHDPTSNFLGYLPYSDASDYYEGARHLLDVGQLTTFTERRPANAAWLAIRLFVSGSLPEATLLQVVFAGMATSYLGFVVSRLFGRWSSMAVVALSYSYSRLFFTTTLSESAGVTFGALGVGLALCGIRSENRLLTVAGMSALALAESFRAGALLAPLGFATGAALLAKRGLRLRTGLLAAGAYLATLLLSPALNAVYGSGKGQVGGNLAYVVAGLSLGGDWALAQKTYAAEITQRPREADQAWFLYGAAAKNVGKDSRPAIRAVAETFRLFAVQTPVLLGSVAGIGRFGLIFIGLLLSHRILRRLTIPTWPLLIAGPFAGGLLLCIPVIYLNGGWRVLAASTPAVFTLLSVLLASSDPPPAKSTRQDRMAALCPALMMVALVLLPGLARRLSRSPQTTCLPSGRYVIRHPSLEPAVLYESSPTSSREGVPVVTPERFQSQRRYSDNPLALRDPPVLLDWAYDYWSHRLFTLVAPPELVYTRSEFVWVDTVPLGPPENHRWVEHFGVWSGCGTQK